MKKIWGLGVAMVLTGLLAGCQSTTQQSFRTVQPTGSTISAVQRYRASDFLGRWVSPTPATSLYLNAHHQLVLFQGHRHTLRERYTLKLTNDQATLSLTDHHAIKLTLNNANSLTMRQTVTSVHLTKDPNWAPASSALPTNRTQALKPASLTPAFKPTF